MELPCKAAIWLHQENRRKHKNLKATLTFDWDGVSMTDDDPKTNKRCYYVNFQELDDDGETWLFGTAERQHYTKSGDTYYKDGKLKRLENVHLLVHADKFAGTLFIDEVPHDLAAIEYHSTKDDAADWVGAVI